MREVDQHVARQIDDRHLERLAEFFLKLHECRAIGHQRLVDRSLSRKDRQIVVGADHGAFDEQPVNAAGIVDRVGQTAARLEVERERARAEMDVEIEEGGRRLVFLAENPGERGRQVDEPTPPRVPTTAVEMWRLTVFRLHPPWAR